MEKEKRVTVRRKADRRLALEPSVVTHEQIAKRAYELYEARGRRSHHELDDWLQAERELAVNSK